MKSGVKGIRSDKVTFGRAIQEPVHQPFVGPRRVSELWAPTLAAFRSLKERWKVSIGAMIQRAAFIEVITEEQHRRLWMA